ncbi:MAG: hypothetical protein ACKO4Z_03295 [Planctomycetota bacterium]
MAWEIAKPHLNPHIERMKHRAAKALQMLFPHEKRLFEDHLIEGVTLERLGREQDLDRRTIRKRIKRAIQRTGSSPTCALSSRSLPLPRGEGRGEGAPDAARRSHHTSRIAWAKLMAKIAEDFPLACPACGGNIRLVAFITEPGPIRKILTHLSEPLEPPRVSPARGPPTDWGELVQIHDDRDVFQASPDELPAIDIHSL